MENTQLPIDRHSKKRAILIDEQLLYSDACKDYICELIDINELSTYYDTVILSTDIEFTKHFLNHNSLKASVELKFSNYEKLKNKYRFLVLICPKRESREMKKYYKCEILVR